MSVKDAESYSSYRAVTSGVPLRSVLGPVLFIIFINHVVSNISSNYKFFADYIKIYLYYNQDYFDTAINNCQRDIDTLNNTSQSLGLEMKASKCVVMMFTPRNCPMQYSGVGLN